MANLIDPLGKLFLDLGDEMTEKDVERLKVILQIPDGTKEKLESATDVFNHLKRNGNISKDDVTELKRLLEGIKNCAPAIMVVEKYEEERQDMQSPPPYTLRQHPSFSDPGEKETERKNFPIESFEFNTSSMDRIEPRRLVQNISNENNEILEVDGEIADECNLTTSLRRPPAAEPARVGEFSFRNYQKELAERGIKSMNNIICAPTGSGKTFTAGYVCYSRWLSSCKADLSFKAAFIVCIRNLISQQTDALRQLFMSLASGSDIRVEQVTDSVSVKDAIENNHVVILTAQTFLNELSRSGGVSVSDLNLLILDECHHTDLKHPYNNIMHIYRKTKLEQPHLKLPQIMGLTASLGVGDDKPLVHYLKICANLDCPLVTHVKDPNNFAELMQYNPPPQKDQIIAVKPRSTHDVFALRLKAIMKKIEGSTEFLRRVSKPDSGSQHYENWIVLQKQKAEASVERNDTAMACAILQKLNTALMTYKDLQEAVDVLPDIQECFDPTHIGFWNLSFTISEIYKNHEKHLQELADRETVDQNPKLLTLKSLLVKLFDTKRKPLGIILTRTVANVTGLLRFIRQTDELAKVRAGKLVGQGPREGTMTDKEQQMMIKRFKMQEINLLVATDVAQEGLDIPKCNFVIRFNFVSNEIGSTQSRGRARAKNSECYLIVEEGSVNLTREHANLVKEHKMMEALDDIDKIDSCWLAERIKKAQEELVEERRREEAKQLSMNSLNQACNVTIYCKVCKTLLCSADKMRKRGSNYICIDDSFEEEKILLKDMPSKKEFREDTHLSYIHCIGTDCNEAKLGQKIEYKKGFRQYGYVLGKDSVMYRVWQNGQASEYKSIKKWSMVPFTIDEEHLSVGDRLDLDASCNP